MRKLADGLEFLRVGLRNLALDFVFKFFLKRHDEATDRVCERIPAPRSSMKDAWGVICSSFTLS